MHQEFTRNPDTFVRGAFRVTREVVEEVPYSVVLGLVQDAEDGISTNKVQAIKGLRERYPWMGLKPAKDIVEDVMETLFRERKANNNHQPPPFS